MNNLSFLLLLDGSVESQRAAEVCQKLAETTSSKVTALYIVDTSCIRALVGLGDQAGLIGSGPHIVAQEQITASMQSLGETVLEAYHSKLPRVAACGPALLEIGDPLEIVQRFYDTHDLIVMGQRQPLPNGYSLSQMITAQGVRPILMVKQTADNSTALRMVGGSSMPTRDNLRRLLTLAERNALETPA